MNREEFSAALKALHEPLNRQEILANAAAKKYGLGSRQYRQEFAKWCRLITSIELKEHELFCQFIAQVTKDGIESGRFNKKTQLDFLIEIGKNASEDKKPAWRQAYKKIKAL